MIIPRHVKPVCTGNRLSLLFQKCGEARLHVQDFVNCTMCLCSLRTILEYAILHTGHFCRIHDFDARNGGITAGSVSNSDEMFPAC